MSYSALVSFVHIKHSELESFLEKLKTAICENYAEIAERDCVFSPYSSDRAETEKEKFAVLRKAYAWAEEVFTYRFFFIGRGKELTLAVVGLPDAVRYLFDDTIYFQDSVDQDYEYETWDKVPLFKRITEQYRERVAKRKNKLDDYHIRSGCYDCVWNIIGDRVFESGLDVRLFSRKADYLWLSKFLATVKERYETKYGS